MAQDAKHTPGPWKARYSEKRDNYQIWGNGHWIANTKCESTPRDHEANAHLISASPDLLEATRGALPFLVAIAKQHHGSFELEDADDDSAIGKLRAAIAKAEGRS